MSEYFRPIINSDPTIPSNASILQGTPFWFTHVEKLTRNSEPEIVLAKNIPKDIFHNITDKRPKICGLSFDIPRVMGILNVTPDSFSDGGRYSTLETAEEHCISMVSAGADIIDIGGESTRPGALEVETSEEISRVIPVIEEISNKITSKRNFERRCLQKSKKSCQNHA